MAAAYPAGYKYTKDHEWIDLAGDRGKVGITDYAQPKSARSSNKASRSARSSR